MLIELMKIIGICYYWTWFIWPFVLVFSFGNGLAKIIKNENESRKEFVWAAISILIILAGINYPTFS